MEPDTGDSIASQDSIHTDIGFLMYFNANIHPVEINPDLLSPLFKATRKIFEMSNPPESMEGCKDCAALNEIYNLL